MTRGRLSLERFGIGPAERAGANPGTSAALDEAHSREWPAEPVLPAPSAGRRPPPDAGTMRDIGRMDAAEIVPPPDAAAPETGAGQAAERGPRHDPLAERAAALGRIAATLEQVVAEQGALRTRCIMDISQALGGVAETLLPRLARNGFAAAVAGATETIARQGHWPELTLRLSAADADPVAAMLGHPAAGPALRLVPDAELAPGEARLDWADGGAEIDIAAIVELAEERFRQGLATAGKEQDA